MCSPAVPMEYIYRYHVREGCRRHLIERAQSDSTLGSFVSGSSIPAARPNLAHSARMNSRVSLAIGAVASAALVHRERKSRKAIERFAAAALETLLNAVEANDEDTGMHVRRVA